jgi:ABC-type multidrug transport system fused ATPase/permease subunit
MNNAKLRQAKGRLGNQKFARASKILTRSDRRKLIFVSIAQVGMGFLDLFGIAIIGILGALAITGVQSGEPGDRVSAALQLMRLESFSFQTQVAILAMLAGVLLVGRTLLSIYFTKRILYFLSLRGASISSSLVSRLLRESLLKVQERTTQQTLYSVTAGVNSLVIGVIAVAVSLITDVAVLIVIALGLFYVDPFIAVSSFLFFAAIGLTLYYLMNIRAASLGKRNAILTIASNQKINEVFSSYRELMVRNRRAYYAKEIGEQRVLLARTQAETSFMPNYSKYIFEIAVVVGAILISASQFILHDAGRAIGTLAVFLAAGTRVAPAILRIQQGAVQIKGNMGAAQPTLDLLDELGELSEIEFGEDKIDFIHKEFISKIEIKNTSLTYPGNSSPSLHQVSVEIEESKIVAIVGPSGAGKTTLVDVLLGVLKPDIGEVQISGVSSIEAISKWPGAISYVPQDVLIVDGTIRHNVALGFPPSTINDEQIMLAIEDSALGDFVNSLPHGLDTEVGEAGAKLSGGQRQRLGIARALYTNPKLLVLDEATSALDGETESLVTESIQKLRGKVTVVMIAHRLSTVRNADVVIYMQSGKVQAVGTFEEVRKAIPNFDHQANLMGL